MFFAPAQRTQRIRAADCSNHVHADSDRAMRPMRRLHDLRSRSSRLLCQTINRVGACPSCTTWPGFSPLACVPRHSGTEPDRSLLCSSPGLVQGALMVKSRFERLARALHNLGGREKKIFLLASATSRTRKGSGVSSVFRPSHLFRSHSYSHRRRRGSRCVLRGVPSSMFRNFPISEGACLGNVLNWQIFSAPAAAFGEPRARVVMGTIPSPARCGINKATHFPFALNAVPAHPTEAFEAPATCCSFIFTFCSVSAVFAAWR